MTDLSSASWYIDVQGNRIGPYTTDQMIGLVKDGEIPPTAQITSDALGADQWIAANELEPRLAKSDSSNETAKASLPEFSMPNQGAKKFAPPPRPTDPEKEGGQQGVNDGADPTLYLFDTLQTARERQNAQLNPSPQKEKIDINFWKKIPKRWRTIIQIGVPSTIVLSIALYFGIQALNQPDVSKPVARFRTPKTTSKPTPRPRPVTKPKPRRSAATKRAAPNRIDRLRAQRKNLRQPSQRTRREDDARGRDYRSPEDRRDQMRERDRDYGDRRDDRDRRYDDSSRGDQYDEARDSDTRTQRRRDDVEEEAFDDENDEDTAQRRPRRSRGASNQNRGDIEDEEPDYQ